MQQQSVCPVCGGEGEVIKNKCKECGGTGIQKGEEVVEINIPAGVAEGMVVNVPGKGNAGKHNGLNGDIQVFIEEGRGRMTLSFAMAATLSITFCSTSPQQHLAAR